MIEKLDEAWENTQEYNKFTTTMHNKSTEKVKEVLANFRMFNAVSVDELDKYILHSDVITDTHNQGTITMNTDPIGELSDVDDSLENAAASRRFKSGFSVNAELLSEGDEFGSPYDIIY